MVPFKTNMCYNCGCVLFRSFVLSKKTYPCLVKSLRISRHPKQQERCICMWCMCMYTHINGNTVLSFKQLLLLQCNLPVLHTKPVNNLTMNEGKAVHFNHSGWPVRRRRSKRAAASGLDLSESHNPMGGWMQVESHCKKSYMHSHWQLEVEQGFAKTICSTGELHAMPKSI